MQKAICKCVLLHSSLKFPAWDFGARIQFHSVNIGQFRGILSGDYKFREEKSHLSDQKINTQSFLVVLLEPNDQTENFQAKQKLNETQQRN